MVVDQGVDVVVADRALVRARGVVGGRAAAGAPAAAVGDPAELLHVHVDQLAGPVAFVADRGDLAGPDHLPGDRVQQRQRRDLVPAPGSGDTVRAGTPASAPIQSGPRRSRRRSSTTRSSTSAGGAPRHRVRPGGPVVQTGLALGGVPVDPGLHALAGDPHRRRDVRLLPAGLVPLDDQQPAVDGQPSITVGHENLRSVRALDKPHPNRGFSSRQAIPPATNVLAGYT